MAKRCPNCKSEISRYQEYCFECGAEIKRVSKRPKHDLGFDLKWFVVGLFLPIVGYVWFFFFRVTITANRFRRFTGRSLPRSFPSSSIRSFPGSVSSIPSIPRIWSIPSSF